MKKFYKFIENLLPDFIKSIISDSLKVNNKWSRTSLTMFTAWISALYMCFFDLYKNGFHMEVFLTLVGVALGSKVTDSISKKINPTPDNLGDKPLDTGELPIDEDPK